jgi:inosine/xanthosine triphosphate pyrophosphatase family protein
LLEGLRLHPVTPAELGLFADPEESADTHEAIAVEKAVAWSRLAGTLAIASDGGLVVPWLGANWESRYTHRFAGSAADDAGRRSRLLQLLDNATGAQREASWVEALAIAESGKPLKSWELKGSRGVIAKEVDPGPHAPGFWVFPLWYFPHLEKYYNQLSEVEKASLGDHWTKLKPLVQEYFGVGSPR